MSTFSHSLGIPGPNKRNVDRHYDEDALLDAWLSRGKSKTKQTEKSTQEPVIQHTPFGPQKSIIPNDASLPLPSERPEFWDNLKRHEQAHTSASTRDKTAFIGDQSFSDGMRGDFHPPSSFPSRSDHEDSSFTARQDHSRAPEVAFTAMSTMANASYSSDSITQADVHENFLQRNADLPKKQAESREGQNKRVSFERTEPDAAHSRNEMPITQPTPAADEAMAFRRSASISEHELAYQGAKKRISDAVSCWQDLQALLSENLEAGKQISKQNVHLKANIAFLESLCREAQSQVQKKDETLAKKDAQLENKDAQLAAKDMENSNERRNLEERRLKLEKIEEALKSLLRDGETISKEWEDLKITVKAEWQVLKVQLENQKSLNKDLTVNFEAFRSKQVSFKKEVDKISEKLFLTEEHLKASQDTVNVLSAKLSAANDDAQRAQQDLERKLVAKDNEIRIADAVRLSSKQELTQMQKELEVAKMNSTTKQNELNTAEDKIKQLRECCDELVEKLNEEKTKVEEREQKAKEQEQKAYKSKKQMDEKTKAIDRIMNERERLEKALSVSDEKVARHKEAEEEFKAREERLKAREESVKAHEESFKAREESLKAREGSLNARVEVTSKVRKETHDRESDTAKGKGTSTQSIDDQKTSKTASASRKKARHEPPPMDSD